MTDTPQDQIRNADISLASRAWQLIWNRKTPFVATLGVALVFTIRVFVCQYDKPYPSELDFEWYGEHCGPGHGDPNREPIDELDEACRRHDAAYVEIEAQKNGENGVSH